MRQLQLFNASLALLVPTAGALAQSATSTEFALEVVLPKPPPEGSAIVMLCVEGCEWTEESVECPAGQGECRALVTRQSVEDPRENVALQLPQPKPIPGSACLGIHPISDPPGTRSEQCKDVSRGANTTRECYDVPVPAADSRAFIHDVIPGSPADHADFKPGDVLVSLYGKAVQGPMDVINVMADKKAGQSFEAQLERDGAPMTVQGRVGLWMSDHSCAEADARLLDIAAKTDPNPKFAPLKLAFRVPPGRVIFKGLAGFQMGTDDTFCNSLPKGCTFTVDQDGNWMKMRYGELMFVPAEAQEPKNWGQN